MMQSPRASFVESVCNVVIGYGVAICSQVLIFPLFGMHVPLSSNLKIGLLFTGISLIRSYAVRRLFNWLGTRQSFVEAWD